MNKHILEQEAIPKIEKLADLIFLQIREGAYIELLDLISDEKLDELDELTKQLNAWICSMIGHSFMYDHCGFWGHKFCSRCNEGQYEELAKRSCGQGMAYLKELGIKTEEEYRKHLGLQKEDI